jgi:lauroyl/myristoyl acyltransferase
MVNAGRELHPARIAGRTRRSVGRVRGMLPYVAYRAGEAVVRAVPHRVAYRLGAAVADAALIAQPRRFVGLRDNLHRVLPDADDRTLRRLVRANVRNLARTWIDVMELAHRADATTARVHPVNVENMVGPLERGRGVVVISLHLGSWELGLTAWNHRFGGRMAVLAEVLQPARLFEHIVGSRGRLGIQVIPIDVPSIRAGDADQARRLGAAAVRDVYRTLRGNGIVAMAIERDLIGNGEPIEFFGAVAPIPTGVVDIAIRNGAAIVPVFLIRAGGRHDQIIAPCYPEITYDVSAPREQEIRRVLAELVTVFEEVIRAHPEQWHVLDPIWPDAAAGGASR